MMKVSQICKPVIIIMMILHVSSRKHDLIRSEVNYKETPISDATIDSEILKRRLIRAFLEIQPPYLFLHL
jgi:hypothetical protein